MENRKTLQIANERKTAMKKMMMAAGIAAIVAATAGCRICEMSQDGREVADEEMQTRMFAYTPTIVDRMQSVTHNCFCDAHKALTEFEKEVAENARDWMAFFIGYQISWPKGSRIVNDKAYSRLIITNTEENLDRIEWLWESWKEHQRLIELKMKIERNGHVVAEPLIVTSNSSPETVCKAVTEFIYPTDYEVVPGQPKLCSNAESATNVCFAVEPLNFTMREVGWIVDVTPAIRDNEMSVYLDLSVTVVDEPEWKDYGETLIAHNGEKYSLPMEQPFFPVGSLDTQISVPFGQTLTLGEKSLRVTVTPSLITFCGKSDKKTNGEPL